MNICYIKPTFSNLIIHFNLISALRIIQKLNQPNPSFAKGKVVAFPNSLRCDDERHPIIYIVVTKT